MSPSRICSHKWSWSSSFPSFTLVAGIWNNGGLSWKQSWRYLYNTWWNLARFQYFHIDRNRIWLNVQVALEDSEPWVSMLADLMGTFPSTGQLNTEVSTPDSNRWGPSYWKNFLWPFQQMSGKSTAICWLSLERHWRSTVTRMTMCCHWSATFWTRMLSSLWLVTSLNLANTLVSRGNQRLLLSRLIWWPGEPISHIVVGTHAHLGMDIQPFFLI